MSRVGNDPIAIPDGVEFSVNGNHVTVKGPKGTLERDVHPAVTVTVSDGVATVSRSSEDREHKSLHGLTRALLNNMVVGVTKGFEKALEIQGVGYRAQAKGKDIEFQLGFSHPVIVKAPEGITFTVDSPTRVLVAGQDKQLVGQIAANIRSLRPPEPYKGKGIRYEGEYVRRKAGKAAG